MGKDEGLDGTDEGREKWITKRLAGNSVVPAAEVPAADDEDLFKAIAAVEEPVYKRTFTADERRQAVAEHHALPNGSVPDRERG